MRKNCLLSWINYQGIFGCHKFTGNKCCELVDWDMMFPRVEPITPHVEIKAQVYTLSSVSGNRFAGHQCNTKSVLGRENQFSSLGFNKLFYSVTSLRLSDSSSMLSLVQ